MEVKQFTLTDIEFKAAKEGPGRFKAYLSTFDNWDRVRPIPERPARGAFTKHLTKFIKQGFFAQGHDHNGLPNGTIEDAGEDNKGVWIEVEYHSHQAAQDARTVMQERALRGKAVTTSMGYRTHDDEYVDIDDDPELKAQGITTGRLLKEIELFEASNVNIPANPMALVTSIKDWSRADLPAEAHFEMALAAVKGFVTRMTDLQDLRAKEGRVLSSANRTKLSALVGALQEAQVALEELLAATEPKADPEEVRKQLAIAIANLQGVSI
jgi:HK97 family phage prohead protease